MGVCAFYDYLIKIVVAFLTAACNSYGDVTGDVLLLMSLHFGGDEAVGVASIHLH